MVFYMKKFVICENIILEIIVRIAQNDTQLKMAKL